MTLDSSHVHHCPEVNSLNVTHRWESRKEQSTCLSELWIQFNAEDFYIRLRINRGEQVTVTFDTVIDQHTHNFKPDHPSHKCVPSALPLKVHIYTDDRRGHVTARHTLHTPFRIPKGTVNMSFRIVNSIQHWRFLHQIEDQQRWTGDCNFWHRHKSTHTQLQTWSSSSQVCSLGTPTKGAHLHWWPSWSRDRPLHTWWIFHPSTAKTDTRMIETDSKHIQ